MCVYMYIYQIPLYPTILFHINGSCGSNSSNSVALADEGCLGARQRRFPISPVCQAPNLTPTHDERYDSRNKLKFLEMPVQTRHPNAFRSLNLDLTIKWSFRLVSQDLIVWCANSSVHAVTLATTQRAFLSHLYIHICEQSLISSFMNHDFIRFSL